jgi:flagellar motor switch protein FliG
MTEDIKLTGPQRAALFLQSLDKQVAAGLMKHLHQGVLIEIAQAMTELDPRLARSPAASALQGELAKTLATPGALPPGEPSELSELLGTSFGDKRADDILREIRERRLHERPFANIEGYPPGAIGRALASESAAVAALVLAHLDPKQSAGVIATFEGAHALEVVRRMAEIVPPPFEVIRSVADDLEAAVKKAAKVAVNDPAQRLRSIAEMLNNSNESVEKSVLEGIRSADGELAQKIQKIMFTWDDLAKVDKRSMQKILGAINTSTLSIALKGASPEVEQAILGNLSTRAKSMVLDEKEAAGALPMSNVLVAREEIVTSVHKLMQSGELKLSRSGDALVT